MTFASAPERLLEAVGRFLEADLRRRKARLTRALERDLERRLARIFRRQGTALLRRFARIRGRFAPEESVPRGTTAITEALRETDWLPLFDAAMLETIVTMRTTIHRATGLALLAGGNTAIGELAIDASFTLKHPGAVAWLETHAAERVTGIKAATRTEIARILTAGTAEGKSYAAIARELRTQFETFARSRAELIAVTEIGDAYEMGNRMVADTLTNVGLEVEKQWLTVGDRRVDPACDSNGVAGWIPIAEPFPAGAQQPTQHAGCRCTVEYRRKGSSFT